MKILSLFMFVSIFASMLTVKVNPAHFDKLNRWVGISSYYYTETSVDTDLQVPSDDITSNEDFEADVELPKKPIVATPKKVAAIDSAELRKKYKYVVSGAKSSPKKVQNKFDKMYSQMDSILRVNDRILEARKKKLNASFDSLKQN
jgi:hypothetical protein